MSSLTNFQQRCLAFSALCEAAAVVDDIANGRARTPPPHLLDAVFTQNQTDIGDVFNPLAAYRVGMGIATDLLTGKIRSPQQARYVAQLLTTLNLYDRAREKKFYGLQRVQEEDISFSLLSTALSYTNIVKHLNLPSREVVEVSDLNDDHAKELLSWMFAQDQHGETVLGESRRLKALAAVVGSTTALSELRKHGKLDQAYLYSDGPGEAFNTMMESAESAIASCLTMLNGEVEVNESHVKAAERISNNADNLDILIKKALRRSSSRQLHGSGKEG